MESATTSEVLLLASQFQDINYLYVAMLALLAHEWLILFDSEVEHIWRRGWSAGKILFIIARYGPLFDLSTITARHISPHGAIGDGTCVTLYKISTWSGFFGICISECILLLRTNAIYSGSKRVMIPLSTSYLIGVVASIVITWRPLHTTFFGPPPGALLRACYLVQLDGMIFYDFVMLLAFEFAVVVLTVRRGYSDFNLGTPLLRVLYRDSVAFFLVLFAVSLSAIFVIALASPEYNRIAASFTRVAHSIICCRILLNLKRAATWKSNLPDVPTRSIAFAAPPRRRTNQTEMSRLEATGKQSNEDGHRLQADRSLHDRHFPTGDAEPNDSSMYNVL